MGDELVIQIQLKDTQSKCKKKRKRVYSKQTKKVLNGKILIMRI